MKAAVLIGLLLFVQLGSALLIGAFNIKSFGKTKAENPKVLEIITKIVLRYDIVLIQEVRDKDLEATDKLMKAVNNGGAEYGHIVSKPLGNSERYLFIYRKSVSVDDKFQVTNAVFSRPPFVVMFSTVCKEKWKFVLIPLHSAPNEAVKEVDALHDVVLDTKNRWNNANILLLGDFNAGGTYIKPEDWDSIRLRSNENYHWLIKDDAHTNVKCKTNKCPYDRIVATNEMNKNVVSGSAKVYYFDKDMNLGPKQTEDVSDHYPVEVELNKKPCGSFHSKSKQEHF